MTRKAANTIAISDRTHPLSFVDVPERAYVEGTLGVYELKRVELLRDVFVWAYERSCQRYMAIRETVAEPDPLRQRHRETLIAIVGKIVRGLQIPGEPVVRAALISLVTPQDIDRVVELALNDLRNLHEGNVARYRLRLSEYRAWQPVQRAWTS